MMKRRNLMDTEKKTTAKKKPTTKKTEPTKAKATTKATATKKKAEPSVKASVASEKKDTGKMYTVSVRTKLNVRAGAGFSYPIVKFLKDGDRVIITSEKDGFGKIDESEWVSMNYLKII